ARLASVPADVRAVLEHADALEYAGALPPGHELALWNERLRLALRELDRVLDDPALDVTEPHPVLQETVR
ncbi:MAG: hypothetical protein M3Y87_22705, partial [Myxococcota bacterium]|nr:hypothetical protein [Myxococcota bacterium]